MKKSINNEARDATKILKNYNCLLPGEENEENKQNTLKQFNRLWKIGKI